MTRNARILLISDLHLEEARDDLTRAFLAFLNREAGSASALFILGDFFNVWIGDDDDRPLNKLISTALRQQADQGLAIFLMHGNRDFLLGHDFAARCGATLIHEPYVLEQAGQRFLLLHGDGLCTQDVDYLKFRALVRNPLWQQDFLGKPLAERRAFAEQARNQSQSMNSNKAADIMDVTRSEVESLMNSHGIFTMIHGHTHRPQVHESHTGTQPCQRIVLGDWGSFGWQVAIENGNATLLQFAL